MSEELANRNLLRKIMQGDLAGVSDAAARGANLHHVTPKERWNFLHQAFLSVMKPPDLGIVRYLLEAGVDPNADDVYGNTPLHYAVRHRRAELVRILAEASDDINRVNKEGVSALRAALLTKPIEHESVKILIESGADVLQRICGGPTIAEHAQTIAHDDPILASLFGSSRTRTAIKTQTRTGIK